MKMYFSLASSSLLLLSFDTCEQHKHPNTLKCVIDGFFLPHASIGVLFNKAFVGHLFKRYTTMFDSSFQLLRFVEEYMQ